MSTDFASPVVVWHGPNDAGAPLVVLLHGRGSDENDIIALADFLPAGPTYAAVRGPVQVGPGYTWFVNQGAGRPIDESLAHAMTWFRAWLDDNAPRPRPVLLIGFSAGAAFAGGLILADPGRYRGAAILSGTLPFDAGVPVTPGRLSGLSVLVAQGDSDTVIPRPLFERTWAYLTEESGAATVTSRDPGGHTVSPTTVAALVQWIGDVIKNGHQAGA